MWGQVVCGRGVGYDGTVIILYDLSTARVVRTSFDIFEFALW